MKKIIFLLITVFFYCLTSFSCTSQFSEPVKDTLKVKLADWPGDNCSDSDNSPTCYPPLSRWKITISSKIHSETFYYDNKQGTKDNIINIQVQRNMPLSITAQPITLNSYNKETLFFKPAGFIYPYDSKAGSSLDYMTWEQGFTASLMETLFYFVKSPQETEPHNTIEEINKFISEFNWKKASEYIKSNVNPWLIDKEKVIEKILSKSFSSIYLKPTSTYATDISLSDKENNKIILSSYIPENETIKKSSKILLKENTELLFYNTKNKGTLFTLDSAKKVSQQQVFLPIYVEEL